MWIVEAYEPQSKLLNLKPFYSCKDTRCDTDIYELQISRVIFSKCSTQMAANSNKDISVRDPWFPVILKIAFFVNIR
jgi:hypothetical protein